jgi:hypothetical protein
VVVVEEEELGGAGEDRPGETGTPAGGADSLQPTISVATSAASALGQAMRFRRRNPGIRRLWAKQDARATLCA